MKRWRVALAAHSVNTSKHLICPVTCKSHQIKLDVKNSLIFTELVELGLRSLCMPRSDRKKAIKRREVVVE